jgi:hypothetical protein
MTRLQTLSGVLVACTALACGYASAASASHREGVFFEAPSQLLNPVTRPSTIATLQHIGVDALRIELVWHTVAPSPNSTRRPAFEATDPAGYNWGEYDPLIEEAHRLGWRVLLTVTSPAPLWATANPRMHSLVTRPGTHQFEEFMEAVGRHYGSEVSLYGIWNEPNHHEFLEPQFNANGSPASPRIYRGLYQAGYAGLLAAGISRPSVLIGETAPEGETHVRGRVRPGTAHNVAPLTFLREALCLNMSYHRAGGCSELQTSGWAIHPYPNQAGPLYVPHNPESITIGSLSRITGALDRAGYAHALPGHLPVYITEFGIMSKPNRYQGVPVAQQAEYDAIAERIAYSNPQVASFSQYLLKDDPMPPSGSRRVAFQTGLEYASGRPKPLLAGFPVPLTVTQHGHSFALWGYVRVAGGTTALTVEVERRGSSRFTVLAQVTTNSRGYWTHESSVQATRWRVRWVSPLGNLYLGPPIRAY